MILFLLSLYVLSVESQTVIVSGSKPQYFVNETFSTYATCKPALSILFVIDVTESQFNKIQFAQKDLSTTVDLLRKQYPDVQIAITTHTDKPVKPLGFNLPTWKDYCLTIRTLFENSIEESLAVLNALYIAGGQDFSESSWDSFMRGALAPQIKWKPDGTLGDRPHIKMIVLVSDAYSHDAGELYSASVVSGTAHTIQPNKLTSEMLRDDVNAACDTMDYPTLDQVSKIIKQKHILPIIITAPAHYACDSGVCPYPELQMKAQTEQNPTYADPVKGMQLYYTEALKAMDVTGFVQHIADTPEQFAASFLQTLDQLINVDHLCTNASYKPPTVAKPVPPSTASKADCCPVDVRINVTVA